MNESIEDLHLVTRSIAKKEEELLSENVHFQFKDMSLSHLHHLRKDIEDTIEKKTQIELLKIIQTCFNKYSDILFVNYLCQACLHIHFDIEPSEKRLSYEIAQVGINPYSELESHVLEDIKPLLQKCNLTDYVFQYTHYDECHNGYFFRRS